MHLICQRANINRLLIIYIDSSSDVNQYTCSFTVLFATGTGSKIPHRLEGIDKTHLDTLLSYNIYLATKYFVPGRSSLVRQDPGRFIVYINAELTVTHFVVPSDIFFTEPALQAVTYFGNADSDNFTLY